MKVCYCVSVMMLLLATGLLADPGPEQRSVQALANDLLAASQAIAKGQNLETNRTKMEAGFNWQPLSATCLALPSVTANKIDAGLKKQFETVIKNLLSEMAFQNFGRLWKKADSYHITKTDVTGATATVEVTFSSNSGREFDLCFSFAQMDLKWSVTDIANDGVSYSDSVREEIMGFLQRDSFANLLVALEKRRIAVKTASARNTANDKTP